MAVTTKRHWFAALLLLVTCAGRCALAGEVVVQKLHSTPLDRDWSYAVYLPEGYEAESLRYPVFYLLHGHNGSLNDWTVYGRIQATADALIKKGEIPPTIIVMPDAGMTWYVDAKEKMETAILRDLMLDVEQRWRTIQTREGRLIGGLSMGGYGSLRFVLQYPEKFAAAALLSPAIYDPEPPETSGARRAGVFGSPYDAAAWKHFNYPGLWDAYLAKKQPVPMYINSGDDDDYMIEAEATKLYSLLRKHRQPAELRIVNGAHTWAVWEATIADAMKYIYRYASRPIVVEPEATSKARR
jgi:enterochelin esterase-like enzyme